MFYIKPALCLALFFGYISLAFATPNAYVVEFNGGVAVLDTANNTLVNNSLNVGSGAWSVAVSPDGARVYFYSGAGQITIVNAATNIIIPPQVPVGCTNDSWITISPDGAFLYIACNLTASILVFDTTSNSVTGSISILNSQFTDLVTNQAGDRLYVVDSGNSVVQVIDTSNPAIPLVLTPFNVNSSAVGIAFSNSTNQLYVPRLLTSDLAVIDVGTTIVTPIPVDGRHVSIDPLGDRIYVSNTSGLVTALDTATNAILGTFNAGGGVYASGVHPLNGRIYVLNQGTNAIKVYEPNAPTFTPVTTIPITTPPSFIEPRINGRWIGPGAMSEPPHRPTISVPTLPTVGLMAMSTMLVLYYFFTVHRRRRRS